MQHVVGGELPGQLVAALRKIKALLVAAVDVHISKREPEETQRPIAAGGDAVDERRFPPGEIHGARVVALGDRKSAQGPSREHLQVDITQLLADPCRFVTGPRPFDDRHYVDLLRIALSGVAVGAHREQPAAVARLGPGTEPGVDVIVHLPSGRHDLEPAPSDACHLRALHDQADPVHPRLRALLQRR